MIDVKLLEEMEVEKKLGDLVEKAEELVDETKAFNSLTDTQMRNVVNVAGGTETVAVVTNFIKYQMGREQKKWKGKFGDKLIEEIKGFERVAEQITDSVADTISKKKTDIKGMPDKDRVWMNLTRHFLGFLNRYFYYRSKVKGGN